MSKYLISLTPTGKFFFGGDMSFPVGEERSEKFKKYNEQFSSYIVRSNYFPQQTSLLGMLRFLLLSRSDAFDKKEQRIIKNKGDAAQALIGGHSFRINSENKFGVINSISTCFLQVKEADNWVNLFPAPMDYKYKVDFERSHDTIINGQKKKVPMVDGCNPKEGHQQIFLGDKREIALSSIFSEDVRVGINKDYSGVTKDSAFYKQINYRLGKKVSEEEPVNSDIFRFAFVADINTDMKDYNKCVVSLGGDNSQFVLEISEEQVTIALPSQYDSSNKVVLLSDAFIAEEDVQTAVYAISATIPFRFLETSIATKEYNVLSNEISRSKRYNLYKNGSVFYFDDVEKMKSFQLAIDSKLEFCKIGYNVHNSTKQ